MNQTFSPKLLQPRLYFCRKTKPTTHRQVGYFAVPPREGRAICRINPRFPQDCVVANAKRPSQSAHECFTGHLKTKACPHASCLPRQGQSEDRQVGGVGKGTPVWRGEQAPWDLTPPPSPSLFSLAKPFSREAPACSKLKSECLGVRGGRQWGITPCDWNGDSHPNGRDVYGRSPGQYDTDNLCVAPAQPGPRPWATSAR